MAESERENVDSVQQALVYGTKARPKRMRRRDWWWQNLWRNPYSNHLFEIVSMNRGSQNFVLH